MRLNLSKDLRPLKEEAKMSIDRQAEALRLKHITPGTGQAMIYQRKVAEAQSDLSYAPLLQQEAMIRNCSVSALAELILEKAEESEAALMQIEARRVRAKLFVDAAKSPKEIEEAIREFET